MISLGFRKLFRANTPQFIVAADKDGIVMDHEGATITVKAPGDDALIGFLLVGTIMWGILAADLFPFFAFDFGRGDDVFGHFGAVQGEHLHDTFGAFVGESVDMAVGDLQEIGGDWGNGIDLISNNFTGFLHTDAAAFAGSIVPVFASASIG